MENGSEESFISASFQSNWFLFPRQNLCKVGDIKFSYPSCCILPIITPVFSICKIDFHSFRRKLSLLQLIKKELFFNTIFVNPVK